VSGPAKPSWPKTPDGTTDWELVFEAEETGLVTMISRANTVDALDACARVVVKSLFTRKNDRPEIARFMAQLETAVAEGHRTGDVEVTRTKVVRVLHQIKGERIRQARKYVAQKNRNQAIDRRAGPAGFLAWLIDGAPGRPLKVGAGLAAVLVIGVAGWLGPDLLSTDDPVLEQAGVDPDQPPAVDAAPAEETQPPSEETEAAAPPPPPAVKKHARRKPAAPRPEYPKAVVLKPFYWSYRTKSGRQRYISYQPFLQVRAKHQYSTICVNAPWVTDAIYMHLTRVHPPDRRATDAELGRASRNSAKKINGRYGAGTVAQIQLVPNTDRRFQKSVTRCALAEQRKAD